MSIPPPTVIVENLAEHQFAKALLHGFAVQIDDGLTSSGAISLAEFSLLEHPDRPVAVLLNARTEDPQEVADLRAVVRRILARASLDGWYVALAVPRLNAWVQTDPRIKEAFEKDDTMRTSYHDQAAGLGRLTKKKPFDPTILRAQNKDYRGLCDFLERALSPLAATANERGT